MHSDQEVEGATWNQPDMNDNNHETASADGEHSMECVVCMSCTHVYVVTLLFYVSSGPQSESDIHAGLRGGVTLLRLNNACGINRCNSRIQSRSDLNVIHFDHNIHIVLQLQCQTLQAHGRCCCRCALRSCHLRSTMDADSLDPKQQLVFITNMARYVHNNKY